MGGTPLPRRKNRLYFTTKTQNPSRKILTVNIPLYYNKGKKRGGEAVKAFGRALLCAVGASVLLCAPAWAEEIELQILVDGVPLEQAGKILVTEGRTLAPFRVLFEALGYEVSWDGGLGVSARSPARQVELRLGEAAMTVNGQTQPLDVAPVAVEGRTLIPVRAVAEASDCDVFWDGDDTVLLYHRRAELKSGFQRSYAGLCTDGSYLYNGSVRIAPDGTAEPFPELPQCNDLHYYKGKFYGRMSAGSDSMTLDCWDPQTGETTCLVDWSVSSIGIWEDQLYFNALDLVGEHRGYYRADLDGTNVVRLCREPLKFDPILADGLAFSDRGEVRSLETGETVARLSTGVSGRSDFFSGHAVSGGKYYLAVNAYYSERADLAPRGILIWDYETGEQELLPMEWVLEALAVTENSIFVTAQVRDGHSIYRMGLDGGHPVLLCHIPDRDSYSYINDLTAIGNDLYYTRGGMAEDGSGAWSGWVRVPMSGGPEEFLEE